MGRAETPINNRTLFLFKFAATGYLEQSESLRRLDSWLPQLLSPPLLPYRLSGSKGDWLSLLL